MKSEYLAKTDFLRELRLLRTYHYVLSNSAVDDASRPGLSPKSRITNTRFAVGVKNGIAKILKLPKEVEHEVA